MKVIKGTSKTNIEFGAGFIQRIQQLSTYLVEGRSAEDLQKFKTSIETNNITEPWVYHLYTVSVLVRDLEKAAEDQGNTEEVPDEQILGPVELEP